MFFLIRRAGAGKVGFVQRDQLVCDLMNIELIKLPMLYFTMNGGTMIGQRKASS